MAKPFSRHRKAFENVPLNDYFESVDRPPVLIKKFFEDPLLSEAYLFLIHKVMHVFHGKIEKLEKCNNSVIETRNFSHRH